MPTIHSSLSPVDPKTHHSGTPQDLERYRSGFRRLTSSSHLKGMLKKRTFTTEVLRGVPKHIAERMFAALDKKNSGHIYFKEYLIGIVIFQTGTPEEKSQCRPRFLFFPLVSSSSSSLSLSLSLWSSFSLLCRGE
jgi:Ca2+-binding EF-hand superfamily protein